MGIAQKYLCFHAMYTYTTAGYPEKGFAWSWLLYCTSACGQVWSLSIPTFLPWPGSVQSTNLKPYFFSYKTAEEPLAGLKAD